MKKLFPIFFIIALMSTSCASLYTAMYAPSEIKSVDGELVFTASAKGYEVINLETNQFDEQETTTSVLWRYETPDGVNHWWVNRDYNEAQDADFWPKDFTLEHIGSTSEEYTGKCSSMTPTAYNHFCKDPETDKSYKIRQFPWGTGYGYFYSVSDGEYAIIYSVPISNTNFY